MITVITTAIYAIIGLGGIFAAGVTIWLYLDSRKHWDRTMR